jgi:signal peptidase I
MLFLKWFTSRAVRHAWQAAKHVEKILRHQSDLLSPEAIGIVQGDINNVRDVCRTGNKVAVKESLARLEKSANKWLKPYPHSAIRENVEVALVAIAVAMGIRTFFLQPFKIPTGSMQPTLYGVTHEDLRGTQTPIPSGLKRIAEYWFSGVQYIHVVAKTSGELTWDPPKKLVLFNRSQSYRIDGVPQKPIWFPPDGLFERLGLARGMRVQAGEDIVRMRVISGDHLFVDRVSYNFRRPHRGDIIVFETRGIEGIRQSSPELADTYYIKRLCGVGGERIQLKPDFLITNVHRMGDMLAGHLVVNEDREITANTPRFENLYSFPDAPGGTNKTLGYVENHYFGHGLIGKLGLGLEYEIPPNQYFAMGDNTFNSSDSRYWGHFDRQKVIGQSFFVYWPIGGTRFKGEPRISRFGWSHR